MHSALFTAALLLAPLVSASLNQHAAHKGPAANLPRANLHRARDSPYQGPRHGQVSKLKRRAVQKRAAEATLKCLTRYTFALCDGDQCTNMGSVALGTACVNNEIVFDDTYGQGSTATDVPANMASLHSKSCDEDDMGTGKPTHTGTKGTIVAVVPTTTTTKHGPSKMHRHPTKATKAAVALVAVTQSAVATVAATTSSDPTTTSPQATPTSTSSVAVVEAAYVATSPAVVVAAVQVKSSSAAAPTVTSSANGPFSDGFATYFYQEGGTGACGQVHADSDKIVAIQIDRYGTGSNNAPDCGRTVSITNQQNGKTVLATVADACPGCKNYDSLDLSIGAFDAIADEASGIVPITRFFTD